MSTIISTSGRKLIVTALVLIVGLAITLLRGDLPTNLLTLLEVVLGGFISGNAIEHLAKVRGMKYSTPAAAPQAMELPEQFSPEALQKSQEAWEARISNIERGMVALHEAQAIGNQGISALLDSIK